MSLIPANAPPHFHDNGLHIQVGPTSSSTLFASCPNLTTDHLPLQFTAMSQLPPQTISIKRKRTEAPVDALRFDSSVSIKRQKSSQAFAYRRLDKPEDAPTQAVPPTPTAERRFHLEPPGVGAKRVFIEARPTLEHNNAATDGQPQAPTPEPTPASTPRPRKRPGAGSALHRSANPQTQRTPQVPEPSENDVRELEALSARISKVDNLHIPLPLSPSKHKPKPPAQRFAARHPEKAAAQNGDADAMDVDMDDYVIDTFIREPILPDADWPAGTVGLLVLRDEDEDWWDGDEESDKEFDTDDEDENAEDYYANDYPEDEMSEDDEFGRDVYQKKYRHGSDDEEYNLNDDDDDVIGSGEDEDDLHFKMTVPKAQRVGYWGAAGEGG
jgi:hypothetical protein